MRGMDILAPGPSLQGVDECLEINSRNTTILISSKIHLHGLRSIRPTRYEQLQMLTARGGHGETQPNLELSL